MEVEIKLRLPDAAAPPPPSQHELWPEAGLIRTHRPPSQHELVLGMRRGRLDGGGGRGRGSWSSLPWPGRSSSSPSTSGPAPPPSTPSQGHSAGAGRQASTHGFVNWLGCVLGRRCWTRTTATR